MGHVVLRVCVACKQKKPKEELIRLVRVPEGKIELDPTGKKLGRGAYLCQESECIKKAIKTKRLEKTLKKPISQDIIYLLNQLNQGVEK